MSLVLALDTATEYCAVAIGRLSPAGPEVVGVSDIFAPRAALSRLLPNVHTLLGETASEVSGIGEVVVGLGPGSFTGVRIGVSTAKGLAHGLDVPLFGVGTLDAVAWRFADVEAIVAVVGDAMRKEVYPALFACGEGRCERLTAHSVDLPQEVARRWRVDRVCTEARELILTGNGLAKYERQFAEELPWARVAPPEQWTPSGATLLQAAFSLRGKPEAGDGDPAAVLPIYTRLSDAEEAERRRR